jgi:enamine deaminase RidA (YjgF/YER057c/UK114 family)
MTSSDRPVKAAIPASMASPAAAYRYSPGVIVPAGDLLFVSGQVGRDENLELILIEACATMADVIEITTFHTSMEDLGLFAEVKARFLHTEPYPAWTGIGVSELALPGLRVEIKATARL